MHQNVTVAGCYNRPTAHEHPIPDIMKLTHTKPHVCVLLLMVCENNEGGVWEGCVCVGGWGVASESVGWGVIWLVSSGRITAGECQIMLLLCRSHWKSPMTVNPVPSRAENNNLHPNQMNRAMHLSTMRSLSPEEYAFLIPSCAQPLIRSYRRSLAACGRQDSQAWRRRQGLLTLAAKS